MKFGIAAETRTWGALFEPENQPSLHRLVIPFQQRPWQWKKERVEALLEDLFSTHRKHFFYNQADGWKRYQNTTELPHFFGSVILLDQKASDLHSNRDIIDGQQRVTATTLVISYLRVFLTTLEDQANAAGLHQLHGHARRVASAIEKRWLYTDVDKGVTRVLADQAYRGVFEKFVVEPNTQRARDAAWFNLPQLVQQNVEAKRFKDRLEFISALFNEKIETELMENGLEHANLGDQLQFRITYVQTLAQCLGECFVYIDITLKDEVYASEVFTSLNSKQQQLLQSDLIKALVFRSLKSTHSQEKVNQSWHKLIEHRPDVVTFFRRLYLSTADRANFQVKDENLAQIYKDKYLKGKLEDQILDVVDGWAQRAGALKLIDHSASSKILDQTGIEHFKTLNQRLGLEGSEIVYLTLLERNSFLKLGHSEKNDLMKLVISYAVRTVKVGGGKIDPFLQKCVGISSILNQAKPGNYSNTRSSVLTLLKAGSSDSDFREAFAKFSTKDASLQFYLLYQIESRLGRVDTHFAYQPPERIKNNIEHIVPKKLGASGWSTWRDPSSHVPLEEHALYVNRLGNLCLLEDNVNKKIQNVDFDVKRSGLKPPIVTKKISKKTNQAVVKNPKPLDSHYGTSKFELVKQLVHNSWDDQGALLSVPLASFDKSAVDNRQKFMADLAVSIWSLS